MRRKTKGAGMANAGRPSKYDPAMCEAAIECGKQGMGLAEIAAQLDISRDTLNEWRKTNDEFSDAIERALDLSQAWWEGKGREGAVGMIDGFNATGYIFQMKNRFRAEWNDTVKTEHSGGLAVTGITRTIVDPTNAA